MEFLQGLISIAISLIAFFLPGIGNSFLMFLIAIWAVLIGILKTILGFVWGQEVPYKWIPKTSGIVLLVMGLFLMLFQPDLLVISSYMAAYTFIFGLLVFIFALNLRALQKHLPG